MAEAEADRVADLLKQRSALAEFGRDAAGQMEDLDALFNRAARVVAECLGVSNAKVLEKQPGRDDLLVRAGCGWAQGVVGHERIGADLGSPAGYALQTGQPVISEDVSKETRFRTPDLLVRHGIKSMVNVLITGAQQSFGVLEVDHNETRIFNENDVAFLMGYANLLAAAVDRFRAHEALREAAEQKMLLLRELRHRVNNNLQQISALLRLQRASTQDPAERRAIDTISARLGAMRLLYRDLIVSGDDIEIDLRRYLGDLAKNVLQLYGAKTVQFDLQVQTRMARLDVAVPIGLIVNEFMTNSLKYAFPDGRGTITVSMRAPESGWAELTLTDNGIGMPAGANTPLGLGISIIMRLLEQLEAKAEWGHENGTRLSCRFRL